MNLALKLQLLLFSLTQLSFEFISIIFKNNHNHWISIEMVFEQQTSHFYGTNSTHKFYPVIRRLFRGTIHEKFIKLICTSLSKLGVSFGHHSTWKIHVFQNFSFRKKTMAKKGILILILGHHSPSFYLWRENKVRKKYSIARSSGLIIWFNKSRV